MQHFNLKLQQQEQQQLFSFSSCSSSDCLCFKHATLFLSNVAPLQGSNLLVLCFAAWVCWVSFEREKSLPASARGFSHNVRHGIP